MRQGLVGFAVFLLLPLMAMAESHDDASLVTSSHVKTEEQATMQAACPGPERRWMTSTGYLPSVAECLYGAKSKTPDAKRVALVRDIQLKATAFGWLNKLTFWVAISLALVVLVWPSFVAIKAGKAENAKKKAEAETEGSEDTLPVHWSQRSATTAAIQTTVAALAALSFAFYAHYKGNQVVAEKLMREIIFVQELEEDRMTEILSAIAEMDKGFGFTTVEALSGK